MTHPLDSLLPHKPPMILIDEVVEYQTDTIHAIVTIREGVPFCQNGQVPAYVALEYMAQTVGVWSGLRGRQFNISPQIGFLLGTRHLKLNRCHFTLEEELHIYGNLKFHDGEMASFECRVDIDHVTVASALLNVFQPKDLTPLLTQE